MSAFVGTVDDIVEKYIDFVPVGLRYSTHYLVYFALLCKDHSVDLDEIETIEDLIDIEKTSYAFVDGLWQYLNSHKDDKEKAEVFYNSIMDNLIVYGTELGYLDAYTYLVPPGLEDSKPYQVYLIHLIEFYKSDIDNATSYEDLEDRDKVSLGTLENIWSYYNYNFRNGSEEDKEALKTVVTAIRDIWEEKRYDYLSMVPEYLRGNDGFLVFLSLMVHEFEIAQQNIENFTDLVNPDKVPMKFLEDLGAYMNYRYLERADDDFNREALMSMSSIWEMRGTDYAIIMAATHGYNPGYVGGDMFIPGYEITNELAELIIGSSRVFVHSRSKFSCIHVYPDDLTYRPGVIILIVPFINDNIRRKIYEVMPAGVRFVFWLFIAAQSDNPEETGIYGEMMYHIQVVPLPQKGESKYNEQNPINLFMTIAPLVDYENYFEIDMFTHSVSPFPSYDEDGKCYEQHLLSGQRLFNILDQFNTNELIACALNIDLLKIPFMGDGYTGDYKIAQSGEYLDTITTSGMPGTSAVRRKFDYYPEDDTILFLCSNVVDAETAGVPEEEYVDSDNLAVCCLPVSLLSEFFAYNILKARDLTLYNDEIIVRKHLSAPFDLYNESTYSGTITDNPIVVYDERSFDINFYYVSPSGEYLDTLEKEIDTVTRTYNIDYRPDVELTFLPA